LQSATVTNTVARECWVATSDYRGLPSSARSWAWQRSCPGFRNLFASKQTTVALQQFILGCLVFP